MVVETDDPSILEQVVALFATLKQETDWWDILTDAEKSRIEKGRADVKNNNTSPFTAVQQKVNQVLKKDQ